MEVKVKPKAVESTMMATKEEDEMKKMKECVVIGQEADEEVNKGQETMKIVEGSRQNKDETRQADSKTIESPSSSSLEMIKKLEIGKLISDLLFLLCIYIVFFILHIWNQLSYHNFRQKYLFFICFIWLL